MSRTPPEISKCLMTAKTIWGAFAGSHCVLAGIAFSQVIKTNTESNQLLLYLLGAVSLGLLLAASLIRMKYLKPLVAEIPRTLQMESQAPEKLQIFQIFWDKYFPFFIGTLALCEGVSICGFLLVTTTGQLLTSIPFFGMGLLMHLGQFPFELGRENWEKLF